ncbi:MAG: alpha-1,2-fucosyltransferase [Candidatus Magasanikbacteria bacterium]
MIVLKLKGGLGNQMFQYAHGRSLEFSGKKVVFDISFFENNKAKHDVARDFKLCNFNIDKKVKFVNKKNVFFDFVNKIKRILGFNVEEYFQSEKYFRNIEDVVRKEFTLKNEMSESASKFEQEILHNRNSVSLHIRRGDYVSDIKTNDYHGVCDLNYYERAIKYLKEKIGEIKIFVFSDDISWVKENLKLDNLFFVSSEDIKDYEELILMSKCQHNIIANSSFSWWGAWLNENKDKIVIAPKKWFNNNQVNNKSDIVPKDWIRL